MGNVDTQQCSHLLLWSASWAHRGLGFGFFVFDIVFMHSVFFVCWPRLCIRCFAGFLWHALLCLPTCLTWHILLPQWWLISGDWRVRHFLLKKVRYTEPLLSHSTLVTHTHECIFDDGTRSGCHHPPKIQGEPVLRKKKKLFIATDTNL